MASDPPSEALGEHICVVSDRRSSNGSLSTLISSLVSSQLPDDRNAFALIAGSRIFQNATLGVILANGAWIGVDTEWNHSSLTRNNELPLEPESYTVEVMFCVFFFVELLIRFLAYKVKSSCLRDAWFVFDAVLWIMMMFENIMIQAANTNSHLEDFTIFRFLRVLRLTRLVRLMRFFPELFTLVKGMARAVESVFFVLLFLMIMIYGTSIVFTSQVGKPPSERPAPTPDGEDPTALDMFGDMGSSMMTLFTNGVLGDNLFSTLLAIKDESIILMWLFIMFMIISGITLLNMLIGVLCQVVQATQQEETEQRKAAKLRETFVKAFRAVDLSGDGMIQEQEWTGIRNNPAVRKALRRMGVPSEEVDVRLTQLGAKVFWDRRLSQARDSVISDSVGRTSTVTSSSRASAVDVGLDFDEFVEQVSDLQWGKKATALDVAAFKCQFGIEVMVTKKMLEDLERCIQDLLEKRGLLDHASSTTANASTDNTPSLATPTTDGVSPEMSVPRPPEPQPAPPPPDTQPPPDLPWQVRRTPQPTFDEAFELPPQPQVKAPTLSSLDTTEPPPSQQPEACGTTPAPPLAPPPALPPVTESVHLTPSQPQPQCKVSRDSLAHVPTEVLLASMKSRMRRPSLDALG